MSMLLPNYLNEMKKNGHFETWLNFNRMVNYGSFPFENIAFLLFMDVCRFCPVRIQVELRTATK